MSLYVRYERYPCEISVLCRLQRTGNLPNPSQFGAAHQRLRAFQCVFSMLADRADLPSLSTVYFEEKALQYTSEIRFQSRFLSVDRSSADLPRLSQIKFERENLIYCHALKVEELPQLQRLECGKDCFSSCKSMQFLHLPMLEILTFGENACPQLTELVLRDLPSLRWFSAAQNAIKSLQNIEVTDVNSALSPKCVKLASHFDSLSSVGDPSHPILHAFLSPCIVY